MKTLSSLSKTNVFKNENMVSFVPWCPRDIKIKFAAYIFVVGALSFTRAERCETFCHREYRPVCGTDGESFKTFFNSCVLRNQHCKDGHDWVQTRAADCQNFRLKGNHLCEIPCTRELRPICGTDGKHFKRFSNLCMLKNEHCKDGQTWSPTQMESCIINNDVALEAPGLAEAKKCRLSCPPIYSPICAYNGQVYKEFSSKCIMESENCIFHNNWREAPNYKCAFK